MRNCSHLVPELEYPVTFLIFFPLALHVLRLHFLDRIIQQFRMFFEFIEVEYPLSRGRHVHIHIIDLIFLLKRVIILLILIIFPLSEGLKDIFVFTLAFPVGLLFHEVLLMFLLSDLMHLPLPHKQFLNG